MDGNPSYSTGDITRIRYKSRVLIMSWNMATIPIYSFLFRQFKESKENLKKNSK